jgi:2-methylcitrate dehydratase PrpD
MPSETPISQDEIGPTETICRFIRRTTYEDLPDEVIKHAIKMIVDSVGVTLAGGDTEAAAIARDVKRTKFDDEGTARVPGLGVSGDPEDISHLMGIMAHALDFDDVHQTMGGHPSVPVLSALLPIAENVGASGRDLLRSFAIGTDVEIRLANAMNPGHYERGWHPTAVLGTMGAAAAVGNMMNLEIEELRNAMGIAASKAAGMKGNFGTMTKPLHVGDAARNGQEAATLAAGGYTGNQRILELDFGGFCDLFKGDTAWDLEESFSKLGSEWALLDPPVGFKPYPCCGSTHAAIDAASSLRERVDPGAIDAVRIEEHPRRLDHTNRPDPESPLDAKFSAQYCVTVMLHEGDIWLDHFEDETVRSPVYQSFLERIEASPDRTAFEDREWGARVTVETTDGQFVEDVDAPKGSAESPISWAKLEEKYRRCAAILLPEDAVESSLETLQTLPELEDASTLMDQLT